METLDVRRQRSQHPHGLRIIRERVNASNCFTEQLLVRLQLHLKPLELSCVCFAGYTMKHRFRLRAVACRDKDDGKRRIASQGGCEGLKTLRNSE